MSESSWWRVSIAVSVLLAIWLFLQWQAMNEYEAPRPAPIKLTDATITNDTIQSLTQTTGTESSTPQIRTGIFIQSIQFVSGSEVQITGYIWQKYINGIDDHLMPEAGRAGFILPEAQHFSSEVFTSDSATGIAYEVNTSEEKLIGWYFDSRLRQRLEFSQFPFGNQLLKVRIWHHLLPEKVILLPDFEAYVIKDQPNPQTEISLIEQNLVLPGWQFKEQYFEMLNTQYNTSLGLKETPGNPVLPELAANLRIQRDFEFSLRQYVLPLFLIATLLFVLLLNTRAYSSLCKQKRSRARVVAFAYVAMLLMLLLANYYLSRRFYGSEIVYLRSLYLALYTVFVWISVDRYLITRLLKNQPDSLKRKHEIVIKIAYWPIVFGAMAFVTMFYR